MNRIIQSILDRDAMAKAIEAGNVEAVQKILDNGLDVDSGLIYNKSSIVHCIECNQLEIGKIFVSKGCSLNLKDARGKTPLHLAVESLNYDFVKLLLDNRADLTDFDDEGRTALHIAVGLNSIRMVRLLMEKASSEMLNMKDKWGQTPFIYACEHGNDYLVYYFINRGCDVDIEYGPYQFTPIYSVVSNHFLSAGTLSKLLDAGANVNHKTKNKETPLLKAFHLLCDNSLSADKLSLVRDKCSLLIDRGGDVNVWSSTGNTPLHLATMVCDEFLVRKLLNAGSLVDVSNCIVDFTPLFYACKRGYQNIADILIDCGANTKIVTHIYGKEKLWFHGIKLHYSPNTRTILKNMASRRCFSLKNSCRLAIRKNLPQNIQKSAVLLPLPPPLIKFLLLE